MRRCIFCSFFVDDDDYDTDEEAKYSRRGTCHRFPPVLIDSKNAFDPDGWMLPSVFADSFCGEFIEAQQSSK